MNKRDRRFFQGASEALDRLQPWYVGYEGGEAVTCAVCHYHVPVDGQPERMYADRLASAMETMGRLESHPVYCPYRQLVEAFKELGL